MVCIFVSLPLALLGLSEIFFLKPRSTSERLYLETRSTSEKLYLPICILDVFTSSKYFQFIEKKLIGFQPYYHFSQFYHLCFYCQVGLSYGRRTMNGYLRQKHNIKVDETRVGKALKVASPINNQIRRSGTSRAVNPISYRADYFGHKIHFDQNEKLIAYGVTQVAAIDGHSRYVVGTCTMPIKNNIVIYEKLYRSFFQ